MNSTHVLRSCAALCLLITGNASAAEPAARVVQPEFAALAPSGATGSSKPALPQAIDAPVEMVTRAKVNPDGTVMVECEHRAVAGSSVRYGVTHQHVQTVEE